MTRTAITAAVLALVAASAARAATFGGTVRDIPTRAVAPAAAQPPAPGVDYAGGPVLHSNRTHLIFWQPAGSGLSFDARYTSLIEEFVANVAAASHSPGSIYGLTGQYRDDAGPAAYSSSYAGATIATDPLPTPYHCAEPLPPPVGTGPGWTACVSSADIEDEITRVVSAHHLPITLNDIYLLLTPNGLGSCVSTGPDHCALGGANGGYCGYHSATSNQILYALIPYSAVAGHCQSDSPRPNSSPADPAISILAHEQIETITDPLGTGWIDRHGDEIADLCISHYGSNLSGSSGGSAYNEVINGGHYYLQAVWSNVDGRCMAAAQSGHVRLTTPSRVYGDRAVTLLARATDPGGGAILAYRWYFDDGRQASHHRVVHTFQRTGHATFRVRTTDSWGNWSFGTGAVQVLYPPPPATRIIGAPPQVTSTSQPRFRFASTAAVATFRCRLDHRPATTCRSPFTSGRLSRGRHQFSVRARDTFGQLSRRAARYAFTVA